MRKWIIPVNLERYHWLCVEVDWDLRKLTAVDSLVSEERNDGILRFIMRCIENLHQQTMGKEVPGKGTWQLVVSAPGPQQENST